MTSPAPAVPSRALPGRGAIAGTTGSTTALAVRDDEGLMLLHRLPVRPSVLMVGGAATSAVGLGAVLLAGGPMDFAKFLFGGGILISIGAGLFLVGALKRWVDRVVRRREERQFDLEQAELFDSIKAALAGRKDRPTLEDLAARLGVEEAPLVRALVRLRDRGTVVEELDADTGNWFYLLAPEPAPDWGKPRDLDARLEDIERSEKR